MPKSENVLLSSSKVVITVHVRNYCHSIGHIRVLLCLCFKTSLSAKPFLRKWVLHSFIFVQIKVIFIKMVSYVDSLWNRGTWELGNDLFLRNCWFYKLYFLQACHLRVKSDILLIYQSQASHDIDIASCCSCVHSCLSFRFQQLLIWITSLSCKKYRHGNNYLKWPKNHFITTLITFGFRSLFHSLLCQSNYNRSITAFKYLKCVQRSSWSSHCFRQKEKNENCRNWLHFIRGDWLCTVLSMTSQSTYLDAWYWRVANFGSFGIWQKSLNFGILLERQ